MCDEYRQSLEKLAPETLRSMIIDLTAALERERNSKASKWGVHILGPDDMLDYADELTALREANEINKGLARNMEEHHPDEPFIVAVAVKVECG